VWEGEKVMVCAKTFGMSTKCTATDWNNTRLVKLDSKTNLPKSVTSRTGVSVLHVCVLCVILVQGDSSITLAMEMVCCSMTS